MLGKIDEIPKRSSGTSPRCGNSKIPLERRTTVVHHLRQLYWDDQSQHLVTTMYFKQCFLSYIVFMLYGGVPCPSKVYFRGKSVVHITTYAGELILSHAFFHSSVSLRSRESRL